MRLTSLLVYPSVLLMAGILTNIPAQELGVITVKADTLAHKNVPVRVPLPANYANPGPLRLVEISGKSLTPFAAQYDSAASPGVWFILPDSTPAGQSRSFHLEMGTVAGKSSLSYQDTYPYRELRVGTKSILRYNYGHTRPPAGVDTIYAKDGGYIHPLFSPLGDTLTGDFPTDHYWHHGIFMPWRKAVFEGHRVDFWLPDLRDSLGVIRFKKFLSPNAGQVFAGFTAEHEHLDMTAANLPLGKPVLNETWQVKVFAVDGPTVGGTTAAPSWILDITSTQRCAGSSPLTLFEWDYQGMSYRGNRAWDATASFLTPSGNLARPTRERWQVMSGLNGVNRSSVVMMTHPQNYHFPEATSNWPGIPFLAYTPVDSSVKKWTLLAGQDYVFRYRFVITTGQVNTLSAQAYFKDFTASPSATFQATTSAFPKSSKQFQLEPKFVIRATVHGIEVQWPKNMSDGTVTVVDIHGVQLGTARGQYGQTTMLPSPVSGGIGILKFESELGQWTRIVSMVLKP